MSSQLNAVEDAGDQIGRQRAATSGYGCVIDQIKVNSPEVFSNRALNAPSLNAIIEQAVGTLPGTVASSSLGIPEFLVPATGSISGMFGGIALGGLALGGLGGGSAGILSGVASSSSLLGGRLVNGYISGARVYQDQDGDGVYDVGEPSATTAADGSYELTIVDGGGSLIAEPWRVRSICRPGRP